MRKSILISISTDVEEIRSLSKTLDSEIVEEFIQKRKIPDINTYVGEGKLDEIKDFLKNRDDIDLVIVNGDLKPSQWFNLEKELGIEVYDRLRLILSIFEKRAESKEAKLQVKLAQLRYERPFIRELIHRARAGEHPGFMAGGEYQVDDYYEMIKKQSRRIKRDLEKIREDREIKRKHRKEIGFYLIAIAGYTNAGKSSLLKILTGEKVRIEEMLFSTLSTKTARINRNSSGPPILLTDTVGFIEGLPSWVIDAFHSTLEEIKVADIVLLVVDVSESVDTIRRKIGASLRELREIGSDSQIIVVLNKIDMISKDELDKRIESLKDILYGRDWVDISVKETKNIDKLLEIISKNLPSPIDVSIDLPNKPESHRFLSELFEMAWVKNVAYGNRISVDASINPRVADKLIYRSEGIGGRVYHK